MARAYAASASSRRSSASSISASASEAGTGPGSVRRASSMRARASRGRRIATWNAARTAAAAAGESGRTSKPAGFTLRSPLIDEYAYISRPT